MAEAGNRWGESPSLPEGEKADRKRGERSPGRESVELCSQDAEAAGALSVVLNWQECAPTTRKRDVGVFFCRHGRSMP